MIPCNYHTHTCFCDGKDTPEEMVLEAIRLGCKALGFSGHSHTPFDDSFSALDFLTEKNLRSALNEKIQGKTQIVVTQRISSAMSADCIFVMDKGCLVDSGKHEELLGRCTIYREIYASQTGGGTK